MTNETKTTAEAAQELKEAKNFLLKQLSREKRLMKIRLVVGIVISVVVFGYMFWLSRTVTRMGTPEFVREAFVTTIKSNAPDIVNAAKRQILSNKKEIIDFLTKEGVDNFIKIAMKEGEAALQKVIARITNDTVEELNKHFTHTLRAQDSRVRELLANPDKLHLEEDLIKALDDELQKSMGELNLDEDFREPLSAKHRQAIAQLNMINRRLKELAEHQRTRKDVLAVRFIKLWASYVQQAGEEEPGEGRCDDGTHPEGPPPQCPQGLIRAAIKGQWRCVNPGTCQ